MNTPVDVRHAQLFLDDEIIEQQVRLRRIIHQPMKHFGNPVYTVGAPWEGTGVVYLGGVYVDPKDHLWKAWYVTLNPPAYPEIVFAVCMIVSEDGFHWRRPEFDVYRGHEGKWTNIVLDLGRAGRTTAPSVIYEPDDEEEPWTMFISLAWPAESTLYKGYFRRSSVIAVTIFSRVGRLRFLSYTRSTNIEAPSTFLSTWLVSYPRPAATSPRISQNTGSVSSSLMVCSSSSSNVAQVVFTCVGGKTSPSTSEFGWTPARRSNRALVALVSLRRFAASLSLFRLSPSKMKKVGMPKPRKTITGWCILVLHAGTIAMSSLVHFLSKISCNCHNIA